MLRWSFAAAIAASLTFGSARVFAEPGAHKARGWCDPWRCANGGCPPGCGGTCVNNECWCDC